MPKYGGWCAYTTENSGEKFDVNPFNCTIENRELYLFYKTCFTDNREKWIQIQKKTIIRHVGPGPTTYFSFFFYICQGVHGQQKYQ